MRLSLDASNVQREKLVFELVKPHIPGFSVEPMEVDTQAESTSDSNSQTSKRKPDTQERSVAKATVSNTKTDKKVEKSKKQKK